MDRQCSSCGGFCKKSGCERENVATDDTSQERVDETEKDQHEPVAWRFQSPTGGWAYGKEPPIGFKYAAEPLYTTPPQSFTYEQVKAHIQVALLSSQPVVNQSLTTEPKPAAWVNLTKKEVLAISKINMDIIDMIYFVEAKIKENNT